MFVVPYLLQEELDGEAIVPAPVLSPARVTGPRAFGGVRAIIPAPILSPGRVTGPQPELDVDLARPITPAPILSPARVTGGTLAEVPVPAGPGVRSAAIKVKNYPDATAITARPPMNAPGSGTFTMAGDDPPVLRELIGFDVLNRRHFTGRVVSVTTPEVVGNEEAGQLPQVTTEGLAAEFDEALVLPDFGAQDLERLGPPTQDSRRFDWTMNGLGVDSPDGIPRPNIIDSVGAAGRYAEEGGFGIPGELFPLPDVWPDPYAKWMWVTDPARSSHPRGWCHFREPFGVVAGYTRLQVWACAYDYAEVFMDGVPILTCSSKGVAQRIELDVRADFHLITVRAYNSGGRAGVLLSVIPLLPDGTYGEPYRRSGGGWKSLAYPKRTFRLNPAQVMNRLLLEARRRRVANMADWVMDFNATYDSAGRPWPVNDEITVQVGATMLDVLNQMTTSLVDWCTPPAGRVLRMYVKDRGTGRTSAMPWVEGQDLVGQTTGKSLR